MNGIVFFIPFSGGTFVEHSVYRITQNTHSVSRTLFSAEDMMRQGSESGNTLGIRLFLEPQAQSTSSATGIATSA